MRRTATLARRRASTGPTAAVVEMCLERAQYSCEVQIVEACRARDGMLGDVRGFDWSAQHRLARKAGGTRNPRINLPSNLLIVCGHGTFGCHGYIESERDEADAKGWSVKSGVDPAAAPVLIVDQFGDERRVLLTDDGRYAPAPAPEGV